MVFVYKIEGTQWLCMDYCHLSVAAIKYSHPQPWFDDNLDSLAGAREFSTIDPTAKQWQIPFESRDTEKIPVPDDGHGHFQSSTSFQNLLELVLHGLHSWLLLNCQNSSAICCLTAYCTWQYKSATVVRDLSQECSLKYYDLCLNWDTYKTSNLILVDDIDHCHNQLCWIDIWDLRHSGHRRSTIFCWLSNSWLGGWGHTKPLYIWLQFCSISIFFCHECKFTYRWILAGLLSFLYSHSTERHPTAQTLFEQWQYWSIF